MRQVGVWALASVIGILTALVAWILFEILGHHDFMATGLGAGAGVTGAALTARWMDKRHEARVRLAQFNEHNNR